MANRMTSPQVKETPATPADAALELMFGYYRHEPQPQGKPANVNARRVISELDAAAAILGARRTG